LPEYTMQALNHNTKILQLTIYSDGAINSMVEDLISGLLVGSPYVLLTGSYWNSSGTTKVNNIWITVIQMFSTLLCNDCDRSPMTDTLPIQQTFPLLSVLNFITSTLTKFYISSGSCQPQKLPRVKSDDNIITLSTVWTR